MDSNLIKILAFGKKSLYNFIKKSWSFLKYSKIDE